MKLPTEWEAHWVAYDAPSVEGSLSLRPSDVDVDVFSIAFVREGWAPWGFDEAPGEVQVVVPPYPTFDAAWCLYMWAWVAEHPDEPMPEHWEDVAQYADDVRKGMWPDEVRPMRAVQAVYAAIVDKLLHYTDDPKQDEFLREALAFCAHVDGRLADGASLLRDDFFADVSRFRRFLTQLEADRDLYVEDRTRGDVFLATIPPEQSHTDEAREVGLLVLSKPLASQFKMWARRDEEAPGGDGFTLLLVDEGDGEMILSADPVKRVRVGWLAMLLDEADPQEEAWYDGARHEGTLVAAPHAGTQLSRAEVVEALTQPLSLERPKPEAPPKPAAPGWVVPAALGAAAVVAVAAFGLGGSKPTEGTNGNASAPVAAAQPAPPEPEAQVDVKGAKGEPLEPKAVAEVVESEARDRPKYALIAGVCTYKGERKLRAPCRDARAMRDLLVEHYGYQPSDIVFMVDKPKGGERSDGAPTAENLKKAVEGFRTRFGNKPDSSFLFFYSGHGGYVRGAHDDYGVLQPTGFFSMYRDQPFSHRGWDMQTLMADIRKGVPAKHIMVVVDACYSGWTGAKGADDLDARVRELWKERAEVILTAATKGQRAWEDNEKRSAWAWGGHSALTAFLLQGLKPGTSGLAPADGNEDHIVTDEELAAYVKKQVPSSVELNKAGNRQQPQFVRFDRGYAKSGQYLWVPMNNP